MALDDNMGKVDVVDAYLESISLACAEDLTGPVYRIIDLRKAPARYEQFAALLQEWTKGIAGASVYPETYMVFVGQPYMADVGIQSFFDKLDTALKYTRSQMFISA
jgi:hypothetical protein